MFILEGRTLGVIAALGVAMAMEVAFDRLSDVADSTDPRWPAAIATVNAAATQSIPHDDESTLSRRSAAAKQPSETVPPGQKLEAQPLDHLHMSIAATPDRPARGGALHRPERG